MDDKLPNSTPLLVGIGVLLFIIGALGAYTLVPPKVVQVPSEPITVVADANEKEVNIYAWQAPENYEPVERLYDVIIPLPKPDIVGTLPVETALANRRTVRSFSEEPLTLANVSQMLWSGIGMTNEDGKRTSPSRGGENPTALFLVAANVADLEPGLYEYINDIHALGLVRYGDFKADWESITHQSYPMNAPAVMMVSGDMYKQYYRYGDITERLVLQESGHIGQNFYLQAETLDLGVVVMGGFDTASGQEFLGIPDHEPVIYLVPFGNLAN